ncbi:MAG: copper amine oxidase N-terminal domain-containing protein [Defluviitaleaceae bacterium]|nr:copper amine oxidase N-terminal domain-containing protein [Defluviitaleaceae bacterium]
MSKAKCILVMLGILMFAPLAAQASEIQVIVDGNAVVFEDVQPIIVNGRTLVPLRGVFEEIGYVVTWDGDTSTASLNNDTNIITVRSGDNFIIVNGEQITSDVPPQIISGRFMIPLRLVSEAIGAEVNWDGEARIVTIVTTPEAVEILSAPAPPRAIPFEIIPSYRPWLGGELREPEAFAFRSVEDINAFLYSRLYLKAGLRLPHGVRTVEFPPDTHRLDPIVIDTFREIIFGDFTEEFFETYMLLVVNHTHPNIGPEISIYNIIVNDDEMVIEILLYFFMNMVLDAPMDWAVAMAVDPSSYREQMRVTFISDRQSITSTSFFPYRYFDIETSVHGHSFLGGVLVVQAMEGVSFREMEGFMAEYWGGVLAFVEADNVYQVHFRDANEAELNDLIIKFNQDERVLLASKYLVTPTLPQEPIRPTDPSDGLPATSPYFELLDYSLWLVDGGYNLSPEVFVFRSRETLQELFDPRTRPLTIWDTLAPNFFDTHILLVINHTERSTAPQTHVQNITADDNDLLVELLTTFPHGTLGGAMMVPVSFVIAVDNTQDREEISIILHYEDPYMYE